MQTFDDLDSLIEAIMAFIQPNDHLVMMSNGGFGGLGEKLSERLKRC